MQLERSLIDGSRYFTLLMSNSSLCLKEFLLPEQLTEWRLLVTTWGARTLLESRSEFVLTGSEAKELDSFLDCLLREDVPCTYRLQRGLRKRFVWKVSGAARHSEFTRELKGSVFLWRLLSPSWCSNVVSLREVREFKRRLGDVYAIAA